jgi:predicted Rossmann-fold nucleotide-binding protein
MTIANRYWLLMRIEVGRGVRRFGAFLPPSQAVLGNGGLESLMSCAMHGAERLGIVACGPLPGLMERRSAPF